MGRVRGPHVLVGVSASLLIAGIVLSMSAISQRESREWGVVGRARTWWTDQARDGDSAVSRRLAEAELLRGDLALFEFCANDDLDRSSWVGGELVVWLPAKEKGMARVALNATNLATARRSAKRSCLLVGDGPAPEDGRYALDLVWPHGSPSNATGAIKMFGRILVRAPVSFIDRFLFILMIAGFAGLLVASQLRPTSDRAAGIPLSRTFLAVGSLIAVGTLLTVLPMKGSMFSLASGVGLAAVQVLAAWWGASALGALAWVPTRKSVLILSGALGSMLVGVAILSVRLLPNSGGSSVATLITWPSGLLAFASLACIAPLGEELFFRGLIYGGLAQRHRAVAFIASAGLFVLAHLPQAWGAWNVVGTLAVVSVVLTALRAVTGSTIACCVAHGVYNITLAGRALWVS